MVFFEEKHLHFQLSVIRLFGSNRAFLHLEIPKLKEVFLSKTNTVLTGEQCAAYYYF
jgi:hypothetical protein